MHENKCLAQLPAANYLLLTTQLHAVNVITTLNVNLVAVHAVQTCFSLSKTREWSVFPFTKLVISVMENGLVTVPSRLKRLG